MIEDQIYILNEILKIIDEEEPDGVLIAGDVYDKSAPSAAAVSVFDDFLSALAQRELIVCIISGNHDSARRLSFGSRIMENSGIYLAPEYHGEAMSVSLQDEYGPLHVAMLPYLKAKEVRPFFPGKAIENCQDAVRCAIDAMHINPSERNILLAHQFVTGAQVFQSEELSVGGLDNVDASVFADFDYTALGHIHGPQNIGGERVRYAGTPLKYSFSECTHKKSVTFVQLRKKGDLRVYTRELVPLHDMAEIRGTYAEVTLRNFYQTAMLKEQYLHITLTDEEDVPEALGRLRAIYHNLMKLDYDNTRTRTAVQIDKGAASENISPLDIFSELYQLQNNAPLSVEQQVLLKALIEKIWEEEV